MLALTTAADAHHVAIPPLPTCTPRAAALRGVRFVGDLATVCFEGTPVTCWQFSLQDRTWRATAPDTLPDPSTPPNPAAPDPIPAPRPFRVAITSTLRVCAPDGTACATIDVPTTSAISEANDEIATNADRSLVAIIGDFVPLAKGGAERPIYLFDAGHGRLIATIHPWNTPMGEPAFFHGVRFLGDTLLVWIADTPVSSAGRLYDGHTGKRLADVGGKNHSLADDASVELGGGVWAFESFGGADLVVHDVVHGTRLSSIKTAAKGAAEELQVASLALLERAADGRTVVAIRGDVRSGITLIDRVTRTSTREAVPTCK
jgi:hypothetical protein